jgi:hypothetical protein
MFRLATVEDIDKIVEIYDDIHTAEENGEVTIGWIREVYPTRKTAEAITYVTGVPLANILRDVESASKAVSEVFGNGTAAKFQTAKMTYRITDNTRYIFADLYYDAKAEKDNKLANEIYRWMKSQGITEEYIKGREKTWKKHRDEEK